MLADDVFAPAATVRTHPTVEAGDTTGRLPLLPQVGIVALVDKPWSTRWMPEHQILSRLSRYFHVVWVNPARDWRRAIAGPPWSLGGTTRPLPTPAFSLYDPEIWLPQIWRYDWLGKWLIGTRVRRARALLARAGCDRFVINLWSPSFERALATGGFDLSCYHVTDEYTFADDDPPLPAGEARLLARVDHVFVVSPALLEKKGGINAHTEFIPNGVDYEAHARETPEPADIAAIPHPRIGYTGWIKTQLDWDLLRQLIQRHRQWSFVFVGEPKMVPEITSTVEQLASLPNVHFLGGKSSNELARYPQHFDVCIMPYRQNGYTKYIFPLKLNEYLASGRPTVGTRIRSLELYADVVILATTLDEWEGAISRALSPETGSPLSSAARSAVARRHDWELLTRRVAGSIAERLGLELPAPDA
jgi:glycosyltransferase involved in cell wall biosynthesis